MTPGDEIETSENEAPATTKVLGYTPLTESRVQHVNHNKVTEELLLRRIEELKNICPYLNHRWADIAQTHFEQGFMALNRAVFNPQRAVLAEDK